MDERREGIERVTTEWNRVLELHDLDDQRVLELGCGRGELTGAIASRWPTCQVLALEVDERQHALNLRREDLHNVRFALAGAESIPLEDRTVDTAFLFKSLHHVPIELLDRALAELARVLVPGGRLHVSEPLFEGPFCELLRLFHDESHARAEAFAALARAVRSGRLELVEQSFHLAPVAFADFAAFEESILNVTHTDHRLTPELRRQVERRFARHMGTGSDGGAAFLQPTRIDLLRRPG